jgi:hypothetical protein
LPSVRGGAEQQARGQRLAIEGGAVGRDRHFGHALGDYSFRPVAYLLDAKPHKRIDEAHEVEVPEPPCPCSDQPIGQRGVRELVELVAVIVVDGFSFEPLICDQTTNIGAVIHGTNVSTTIIR